jgi:hypothetical protein
MKICKGKRSKEGEFMYNSIDLCLVRDSMVLIMLTHCIALVNFHYSGCLDVL